MSEEVEKASELYSDGLYCSQAVLGAFCEKYGLDKKTAFRISCGLNSGVRCAEICGAVSGAVMVIGLRYGDSAAECNERTEEFVRLFRERNGSTVCRDLMGCDIFTAAGKEKAVREGLFNTACKDLVISAAQILKDLGQ